MRSNLANWWVKGFLGTFSCDTRESCTYILQRYAVSSTSYDKKGLDPLISEVRLNLKYTSVCDFQKAKNSLNVISIL